MQRADAAILITGAARGLGFAMAEAALQAGAQVVAADVDEGALASAPWPRDAGDRLLTIELDIRAEVACEAAVARATRAFGRLDVLVNNAGIGMEQVTAQVTTKPKPFFEVPSEIWRRIFDVNVNGTFNMTRAVVPAMLARGHGRIINVVTSLSTTVRAGFSPYGPSKAAIEAMTVIWSKELAGTGVTVNALLPGGPADTRMIPEDDVADRSALRSPSVMVAPFLWLCTDHAADVTGMRIVGDLWDANLPVEQAMVHASAPAAWAS